MSTDTSVTGASRAPRRAGPGSEPPLGPLALMSTGMLVGSIVASAALGGVVPSPLSTDQELTRYFAGRSDAVLACSLLTIASTVPLAIVVGVLTARLRLLGITRGGATTMQTGGILAVAATALSGLLLWGMSDPQLASDITLLRALGRATFAIGGPGFAIFFAVMALAISFPAKATGILPGWVSHIGFALAVLAVASLVGLLWSPLFAALPLVRFGGMAWLAYVCFALPASRARRTPDASS